ncbi:MAG: hypothetical protein [Microvirus sp.]|nr:MAG: hypothetical protein [Microvirus sp.]
MRPLSRHHVHKQHSAKSFRHQVSKTHKLNVSLRPMRGGWRL